jgi:hypothetical protein
MVTTLSPSVVMSSTRPYRRALPFEKARQVISENWGAPFDPALVEAFLSVLDRMERRSRMRLLDRSGPRPEAAGGPDRASLDPLGSGATIPAAASRDGRDDPEDAAPASADGDAVSMETNP